LNMTDPIADMLTRIRNGMMARHDQVVMPASNLKMELARILKEEGYIKDFEIVREKPKAPDRRPSTRAQGAPGGDKPEKKEPSFRTMRVWLRYTAKREPVITGIKRVSKPGLRVYRRADDMPRVLGGLGSAIVTTPRGVMTAREARRQKVGGEVLCYVW
jgi:small subunit ribosomal protein S8